MQIGVHCSNSANSRVRDRDKSMPSAKVRHVDEYIMLTFAEQSPIIVGSMTDVDCY